MHWKSVKQFNANNQPTNLAGSSFHLNWVGISFCQLGFLAKLFGGRATHLNKESIWNPVTFHNLISKSVLFVSSNACCMSKVKIFSCMPVFSTLILAIYHYPPYYHLTVKSRHLTKKANRILSEFLLRAKIITTDARIHSISRFGTLADERNPGFMALVLWSSVCCPKKGSSGCVWPKFETHPQGFSKLEFNIVLTFRQKWHWDFWHFVQNTWGIEANLPDGRAVKICFRLAVRTMPVPTQTSPSTLSASQPNATRKKL